MVLNSKWWCNLSSYLVNHIFGLYCCGDTWVLSHMLSIAKWYVLEEWWCKTWFLSCGNSLFTWGLRFSPLSSFSSPFLLLSSAKYLLKIHKIKNSSLSYMLNNSFCLQKELEKGFCQWLSWCLVVLLVCPLPVLGHLLIYSGLGVRSSTLSLVDICNSISHFE